MFIRSRVGKLMKEKGLTEGDLWKQTGVPRNTIRALARDASTRVDSDAMVTLEWKCAPECPTCQEESETECLTAFLTRKSPQIDAFPEIHPSRRPDGQRRLDRVYRRRG